MLVLVFNYFYFTKKSLNPCFICLFLRVPLKSYSFQSLALDFYGTEKPTHSYISNTLFNTAMASAGTKCTARVLFAYWIYPSLKSGSFLKRMITTSKYEINRFYRISVKACLLLIRLKKNSKVISQIITHEFRILTLKNPI